MYKRQADVHGHTCPVGDNAALYDSHADRKQDQKCGICLVQMCIRDSDKAGRYDCVARFCLDQL